MNWRVISIRVFIRLSNLNTFPTGNNVSFPQEILFRKWEAGKPWHKCYTETTATGSVGLEESLRGRGTKGLAWEQKGNDRLSDRCTNWLSPWRNTWLQFYYASLQILRDLEVNFDNRLTWVELFFLEIPDLFHRDQMTCSLCKSELLLNPLFSVDQNIWGIP